MNKNEGRDARKSYLRDQCSTPIEAYPHRSETHKYRIPDRDIVDAMSPRVIFKKKEKKSGSPTTLPLSLRMWLWQLSVWLTQQWPQM